jgi:GxxExxY protein
VHRSLGSGLFESVDERVLAHELELRGLQVQRQKPISVCDEDQIFDEGFRADLVVNDCLLIELKPLER